MKKIFIIKTGERVAAGDEKRTKKLTPAPSLKGAGGGCK